MGWQPSVGTGTPTKPFLIHNEKHPRRTPILMLNEKAYPAKHFILIKVMY
jgi:hypothetical protein